MKSRIVSIIVIFLCFFKTHAFSFVENKKDTASLNKDFKAFENNIFSKRIDSLNIKSPIKITYNQHVQLYINKYLEKEKVLISRMLGLSKYYFPMFEESGVVFY